MPYHELGTLWADETQYVSVDGTGYQSFFPTQAERCWYCNSVLHEEVPYVYAVENIVVEDPSIVELVNVPKTGTPVSLESDPNGYPELHVNFKGLKAGTTTISYDLDYEFYYSGASGYCNFCGRYNSYNAVDTVYSVTIKFTVVVSPVATHTLILAKGESFEFGFPYYETMGLTTLGFTTEWASNNGVASVSSDTVDNYFVTTITGNETGTSTLYVNAKVSDSAGNTANIQEEVIVTVTDPYEMSLKKGGSDSFTDEITFTNSQGTTRPVDENEIQFDAEPYLTEKNGAVSISKLDGKSGWTTTSSRTGAIAFNVKGEEVGTDTVVYKWGMYDNDDVQSYQVLNINMETIPMHAAAIALKVTVTDETPTLKITKTVDKTAVKLGGEIGYTITVKNEGSADATNVVVKDSLPEELEYVTKSGDPSPSYDDAANTLTWDAEKIGTIAPGGEVTITFKAKAVSASKGVKNSVAVSSNETAAVQAESPETKIFKLDIAKKHDQITTDADAGTATIPYTITVKNASGFDLYGLDIVDTLLKPDVTSGTPVLTLSSTTRTTSMGPRLTKSRMRSVLTPLSLFSRPRRPLP